MREKLNSDTVRHGGDTVENEASLKQVVAQIVTELQVTMLKPWRGRPHVRIVDAQLSLCTDVDSQCCTSTDLDLSFLVVTAPLSPRQESGVPYAHRTP